MKKRRPPHPAHARYGRSRRFAQDTEWVRQTPIIFVEPHDWMLPKQSTVRNFLSLMASQERDILVQHENIVAVAHELG